MNLHPKLPHLLNEKPVPVLPHPEVDLDPVPKSPEQLQDMHLGPARLSAGDEVEKAHVQLHANSEKDLTPSRK